MKKYTKEIVLVLITAIVVSVVSVSATVYFNSENILFVPDNSSWNVSNTSSALNDLYSYANSGDATASNILVGKTALVNGTLITGTMTDNGTVSTTINPGGSYTIPAGYHNGSGKVTATSATGNVLYIYHSKKYTNTGPVTHTSDTVTSPVDGVLYPMISINGPYIIDTTGTYKLYKNNQEILNITSANSSTINDTFTRNIKVNVKKGDVIYATFYLSSGRTDYFAFEFLGY